MNENTIQDLLSLKEDLLNKVSSIDQILTLMGGDSGSMAKPIVNNLHLLFKQSDSYKDKIAKVLKAENKFLNITQIINLIHSASPKSSREEIKDGIGGAKSLLLKDGTIVKITVGASNQNSFYGSPNWLAGNGQPKPEHMYDESLIKEKKKIEI